MANTYSQIFIQIVFYVKGRNNFIHPSKRIELEKYITGIMNNRKQKLLAIYANPDHVHLLFSFHSLDKSLSEIVRDIKAVSSKFINDNHWLKGKFHWQEGYGAFSYSKSQVDKVCKYILNQEEHHKRECFQEEYLKILKNFEIEYDEKYLFEFYDYFFLKGRSYGA